MEGSDLSYFAWVSGLEGGTSWVRKEERKSSSSHEVKFPKGDILITGRLFAGSIFHDTPAPWSCGDGALFRTISPICLLSLYKGRVKPRPLGEAFSFLRANRAKEDSLDSLLRLRKPLLSRFTGFQ